MQSWRLRFAAERTASVALLCVAAATELFAQAPAAARRGSPSAPGAPASAPAAKPETPAASRSQELPKGYEAPVDKPTYMEPSDPLLTEEELKDLNKDLKNLSKYKAALRNGDLKNEAERDAVKRGIKYRIAEMSQMSRVRELSKMRAEFIAQELNSAAKLKDKPQDVRDYRQFVLGEVVNQAKVLLDKNLHIRLNAVFLLAELDIVLSPGATVPAEAFADSLPVFTSLVESASQPEPVKIAAVRGIWRAYRYGNPQVKDKLPAAIAVIAELQKTDNSVDYQIRLVSALSACDQILDFNRQPLVTPALLDIVNDPKRSMLVRCEAARALGRAPLASNTSPQVVMQSLVTLTQQAAVAQQKDPKDRRWWTCFANIYLAFKPENPEDLEATRKGAGGLIQSTNGATATAAKAAFAVVQPVLSAVMGGIVSGNPQPIEAPPVQALEAWLQKNRVGGVALDPSSRSAASARNTP